MKGNNLGNGFMDSISSKLDITYLVTISMHVKLFYMYTYMDISDSK